MDDIEQIKAREPAHMNLRAQEVKKWTGLTDYLFWERVKRGNIKKDTSWGKAAYYNKTQIKEDLGI